MRTLAIPPIASWFPASHWLGAIRLDGRIRRPKPEPTSVARILLLLLLVSRVGGTETTRVRPNTWAQPVIGSSLENFYRVSEELYRSEQPAPRDIPALNRFGIKSILSLREYHHDSHAFAAAGITSLQYEMNAGAVSVPQLIDVLRLIRFAPQPVLVHCWHGSDRTGFVIAGYRMVFMHWTAEQAIDELRAGGFGLHERWYPNIARVLNTMDVAAVRKAVLEPPPTSPPAASSPARP